MSPSIKKEQSKVITALLPRGSALEVVKKLKSQKNIVTASVSSCRGMGMSAPKGKKGVGQEAEKDVLIVPVPADKADEIFEFIYIEADINRPHGGMMYMANLMYSVPMNLPDLPEIE